MTKGRKSTQRGRLLAGLVTVANRDGYARTNVSAVIAEAGVSRPTFYDYFADKDNCFLEAMTDVHERLLDTIRAGIEREPPECAMAAVIRALVSFAGAEPARARFLINEPLAGGPTALEARDRGIVEVAQEIESSYRRADPTASFPDFSSEMLVGGLYRLLAPRLRRGEPNLTSLVHDLVGWVQAYDLPGAQHRWRDLEPEILATASPFVPETPLHPPSPLPPGRTRMPEEQVAENQRLRIMFAAARTAEAKGYAATTVGDITRLAGVDGRAFYGMFADKQDAFMAVHELGFKNVMDVTAGAFFAGSTWPERNWEAGRAFTQFLERNPLIANVGFVEAYAVGPGAVQRLEDSRTAFAMLLQEGYQHVAEETRPSRLVLEAIITTIFEIVYRHARESGQAPLSGMLPHLTFLVLTPFLGPAAANAFIEKKRTALEPAPTT